jgi:phosphonate transport system permease protein
MAGGSRRSLQSQRTAPGPNWLANRSAVWAKRIWRRLFILLIDAAFLAYLFVMGSYVATRIASGVGVYLSIPGDYVVVLAIAAAIAWGAFGTSVGKKAVEFLSGRRSASGAAPGQPSGRETETSLPGRTLWYRTLWGWSVIVGLVVTLAAATIITEVDFSRLVKSFPDAAKILRRVVRPDASIFGEVVRLTIITVFMGLISTLLAIPVAVVLSFFGARNLTRGPVGRPIYVAVRAFASIVRSIEPIIWAIIFVIWVRPGPFPGMLALFVCSIADLTKLYSEQLESIDPGPAEAITAVGGRRLQVLLYSIVPQIINPYLSFTLYRWDINVRMGTVIGMVGGGGIGMLLMQYVRVLEWEEVSMCLVAIIVVVWSIDTLSARLRARLS